jgi:hypothetical protein
VRLRRASRMHDTSVWRNWPNAGRLNSPPLLGDHQFGVSHGLDWRMGRGMKRILGLCGASILLMLGCTSTDYPRGDHLLQCCSGCTCNYLGNYRFRIEALGNRWNSYAKPGWDKVPTLEEIALVGAADVALRYQRSYFEILENERTHVWEIGLILGYRRRALHRLVIRVSEQPEDEDAREILTRLAERVGYGPR